MTATKKGSKGGGVMGQPLDPSQNAREYFGDPSGLTGISTDDTKKKGELSPELYEDDTYNKSVVTTMSQTRANIANDIAEEDETQMSQVSSISHSDEEPYLLDEKDASGDDSPAQAGEQSVSGSTPDPTADDDTLETAHAMGQQLGEDEEHPQELDIARDIDEAEESIRTH
jgi:hypothetical protein